MRYHKPAALYPYPYTKPATVRTQSHEYHLYKVCIKKTYHMSRPHLFYFISDLRTYSIWNKINLSNLARTICFILFHVRCAGGIICFEKKSVAGFYKPAGLAFRPVTARGRTHTRHDGRSKLKLLPIPAGTPAGFGGYVPTPVHTYNTDRQRDRHVDTAKRSIDSRSHRQAT